MYKKIKFLLKFTKRKGLEREIYYIDDGRAQGKLNKKRGKSELHRYCCPSLQVFKKFPKKFML